MPHSKRTVHVYSAFASSAPHRETAIVAVLNWQDLWKAFAMRLHEQAREEVAGPLALSYGLDHLREPCDVRVIAGHEIVTLGLRDAASRAEGAASRATWHDIEEAFGTHALAGCRHDADNAVIRLCEEFALGAAQLQFPADARLDELAAAARALTAHRYRTPEECECDGRAGCPVCEGGLGICKVCGNLEGALTTHCPGAQSYDKSDEIYAGRLDYVHGEWVAAASIHCPSYPALRAGAAA